jgi:hypothetical protein
VDRTQWRPIVQASDIHFWKTGGNYRAEEWAAEHLEDVLLAFYRRHRPGAKGALIVNSIATAHRLLALLQPAFAAEGLCVSLSKTIKDSYETARAHLKQAYWDVLGVSTGRALSAYLDLMKNAKQIAEEAQSFRGGSPFECGVIDVSEAGADGVKRYGLLTLAANADLDWLGLDEFKREAAGRAASYRRCGADGGLVPLPRLWRYTARGAGSAARRGGDVERG